MEINEAAMHSRMYRYIKITLIILGAVLVLLFVFFVRDYFSLRHQNIINARELSLSAFTKKHGPLTADETGVIRSWMTFGYVTKLFALPPDFLKNTFHITDPRYPNLTLSEYTKEQSLAEADFMPALETAISSELRQLQ